MYLIFAQTGKILSLISLNSKAMNLCALILILAGFATVTVNLDSSKYKTEDSVYSDAYVSYRENIHLLLIDLAELENNTEEWIYTKEITSNNYKNKDLPQNDGHELKIYTIVTSEKLSIGKNINKDLYSLFLSPHRSPPYNS